VDSYSRPDYHGRHEVQSMDVKAERNERYLTSTDHRTGLGARTARGSITTMLSEVLRFTIQICGTVVLSRILTPADFGLIATAATVTIFISMFTDMGLSGATIQRQEIDQKLVSTLFAINLGVGIGLWLLTLAVAPIAAWFFGDARVGWVVAGIGLGIPFTAVGVQHKALLNRNQMWTRLQFSGVAGQLIALLITITLLLTTNIGFWALVFQQVGASLIVSALCWILCSWRPTLPLDFHGAREGIAFGGYLTGFSAVNYFHRQGDNLLIGWRWGPAELGYYNRAYNLLTMPLNVMQQSFSTVAVQALARLQDDEKAWNAAFLKLLCMANFFGIALCAGVFAAAEPLVLLLLGPQWMPVIPLFRMLSLSSILATSTNCLSWVFFSRGRGRELFRWSLFATPFFVLSFVVGLPWRAWGVAFAYVIAMGILAPIYLVYAIRLTTIPLVKVLRLVLPIYVIAAGSALAGEQVAEMARGQLLVLGVILSAGTTGLIYGVACLALIFIFPDFSELRASLGSITKTLLERNNGKRSIV
jgi:PST family polysaccharide transporter